MSWNERLKTRAKNFFSRSGDEDSEEEKEDGGKAVQYRLEATSHAKPQSAFWRIVTLNGCLSRQPKGLTVGINPNQKLAMYLHWMFRVNFVILFSVMCVTFFALVILFAGFIALAGNMDAECVRIGGAAYNEADTGFADAVSA